MGPLPYHQQAELLPPLKDLPGRVIRDRKYMAKAGVEYSKQRNFYKGLQSVTAIVKYTADYSHSV